MSDLKALLDKGSRPPESNLGKAGMLAGSAILGKDALQSTALGLAADVVSPQAGDHLTAFARSGNLSAGVAGAVIGAVKPASEHDEDSLAVAASLASNPAAAAAGYAAVQLGGDRLGDKGIAAVKLLAAGAGIAAGAPVLMGAYGLYEGGRELYESFTTPEADKAPAQPPEQNSFQPSRSLVAHAPSTREPQAAPYIEKEPSPEYVQSMDELSWGPGR